MMMGMGVSAGPIPEDFFQNTISSLQAAASLPPVGVYNQSQSQTFQGTPSNGQPLNYQGLPNDFGLFGSGVPPQVSQPSGISSALSMDGTPVQGVGLPDGGIPPQGQLTPVSTSSSPIDLGIFETPTAALASKNNAETPLPASAKGDTMSLGRLSSPPIAVRPGQVPRGAAASKCFKAGLAHLEQNQLSDAMSCMDEAFLPLAKDQSLGVDIRAQASICAQYKIAVLLLQEISRLQRVQGPSAVSVKEEMARLSRHLGSLPLLAKHQISCIRTAIKRNMTCRTMHLQNLTLIFSFRRPLLTNRMNSEA